MPTLNWIGKEAITKLHRDVPFRLLEPVPERSRTPRPQAEEGQNENRGKWFAMGYCAIFQWPCYAKTQAYW